MTAQIGVINKKCVALATDSAVTIGRGNSQKAFNTAEKLFTISSTSPVGIMIYNNAEFIGIPWEIIIKDYKRQKGMQRFDTLKGYVNDFFAFVKEYPNYYEVEKRNNILRICYFHLNRMLGRVDHLLKTEKEIDPQKMRELIIKCNKD